MSEPSREHILAVQDGISGWPIGTGYYATQVGTDEAWDIATGLLTSTDPAVLDALQDALVRAGRLTEQVGPRRAITPGRKRRLATDWTEWQEVPDV